MNSTFHEFMPFVLKWEGVWSDHPMDKGGKTKYGIIESELPNWFPGTRIEDLSEAQARHIYWHKYFVGAGIEKLPDWLGLFMFDTGINMGRSRAKQILQMTINNQNYENSFEKLKVDRVIGPKTLAALAKCDKNLLFCELIACRMYFYRIFRDHKYFGAGWGNRANDLCKFYDMKNYMLNQR